MNSIQPKFNDLVPLPWWATESLFWIGFCLTSFVSLSLFYGQPSVWTIVDLGFEAIIGALFTRPILWSAPKLSNLPLLPRISILMALVVVCSQAWNLARMLSFPYFFPGAYIWNQFGGWAFSATLVFCAWTALFYTLRAYKLAAAQRELANQEYLRRLNAEKLSSNAELKMLRYQINPHFIFNSLNSINALIATNRNSDARRMIEGFSSLLRRTLERDPPLIVPLAEELDTSRRYLEVEQMRFAERLTFSIEIDESLTKVLVPSLILQPLVENAVRHGLEAQSAPCEISIVVRDLGRFVSLSVLDTGAGLIHKGPQPDHTGLGLQNICARLESVYGPSAQFELSNRASGGAQATLVIPRDIPEAFR